MRALVIRSLALALLGGFAVPVRADGPAPAPAPVKARALPEQASDEDAQAALLAFEEAWKAKGLKGDDRLMERDRALGLLAKVHHPLVVLALGEVAKTGDDDLRPVALVYLGLQKGTPGLAGEMVLAALKKHGKDVVMVLSGLQSLGQLKYLGGDDTLKDLLKTEDYTIKKCAITTVGQVGDMRLMDDLLKILGVDPKGAPPGKGEDDKKGGKEVVEEGYSYEGAEASVDTGTSGDGDQKAAEAKAKEQIARNKAAAGKGGGGGGAGGAGDGGGGGGRGGSARSKEELKPYILKALKQLTGETFMGSKELREWLRGNGPKIADGKKAAEALEAEQRAALKK